MPLQAVGKCRSTGVEVELYYETFGSPDDPLLLLCCPLGGQCISYNDSLCGKLAEAGPFHVVRYDQRDIGESTKFEQLPAVPAWRLALPQCISFGEKLPYTLEDIALDAVGLIAHFGRPAHLFGCSMGGMVAQLIAIHAPAGQVLSLTSVMSTTGAKDLPQAPMWVLLEMIKGPKTPAKEHVVERKVEQVRKVFATGRAVDEQWLVDRTWASVNRSTYSAGTWKHTGAIQRTAGRDEQLRKLDLPATVVHGAKDILVPPSHGRRTHECLRGSEYVEIPDMGHLVHPDDYDRIAGIVRDTAARAKKAE